VVRCRVHFENENVWRNAARWHQADMSNLRNGCFAPQADVNKIAPHHSGKIVISNPGRLKQIWTSTLSFTFHNRIAVQAV
jgi:hypothetical protein